MRREPGPRAGGRRAVVVLRIVAVTALPWAWFGLRDALGLAGDVLAIFLPALAVVAAVGLVVVNRRLGVPPAVSVLLAGAVAVAGPWTPADAGAVAPGRGVTVAGANVTGMPGTLPALRGVDPDVLAVVEDAPELDAQLAPDRPYHLAARAPGIGVYSSFPLRPLERPGPDFPGIRAVVAAPTPFVVYALHVPKPWVPVGSGYFTSPANHHRLVTEVAARVARERRPVVILGDLNSTDRARDYRLLTGGTGLTDAMRDGWAGPTSVTTWLPLLLRIDHVLVGPGWCGDAGRRFTLPGSDHDGVVATVGPCS
ncbi:endonuclease/exonuclease/phosphatase family protein [Pseudonocardia endophytica]|uniref:Endonuclease/exonuclease/phosphatase family protein n=1 Tax=Pseudonocardia endophytica TaxID=401976 RepID=A0A4R1HMB5_PSEEN|nr:endonuclease/exonuclease/phosphatase family protein [Pseudonocardia endophytica]TCK21685.1 endonuclease/exonuclease/phosphatase family protein [Pseudonocardia endophytica]